MLQGCYYGNCEPFKILSILDIVEHIKTIHEGDSKQLEFILSESKRIVVEAAAGYGKTKTMISKIAYLIANKQVPNPKRILALTFSVNAALKIKKDVAQNLPNLLKKEEKIKIEEKIYVSNYHGLCRRILKRYGHRLAQELKNVDTLTAIDGGNNRELRALKVNIDFDRMTLLENFNNAVKSNDKDFVRDNFDAYNDIVIRDLLPQGFISFNSLLTLTIALLRNFPKIRNFYLKYFKCIFIDEFQDTNLLSYGLIKYIVSENTSLYLLGDSLQRIYGFIGAIPEVLQIAKDDFSMDFISLEKNYRFRNNPNMLLLDYNIRKNAESLVNPNITEECTIDFSYWQKQEEESQYLLTKCKELNKDDPDSKTSILFRGRNNNTNTVIDLFESEGLDFFYALYSDEDSEYKKYHFEVSRIFNDFLSKNFFSKKMCNRFLSKVKETFIDPNPIFTSLNILLEIFIKQLFSEYYNLDEEDKITLIKDTFDGNGLKQYIEYVESNIIFTTIHGAKGLEWDYVMLPDMEQNSLPNYFGGCKDCTFSANCEFQFTEENEFDLLDELSVFYVGFTRAKKQVFFSASKFGYDSSGNSRERNISCFLKLKGIKIA